VENKNPDCFVGMQSYIFLCIFSLIFSNLYILGVKRNRVGEGFLEVYFRVLWIR